MYLTHTLIALTGNWISTAASNEVWQFGVRVVSGGDGTGPLTDPQAYADDIASDIASWFSSPDSGMSADAQLQLLKVNNINPDGTYADPVTHEHEYASGLVGGNSTTLDGISSLCYSWTTPRARGLAHRGRVYPPNCTYTLAGPFAVNEASQEAALLAAGAFLDALTSGTDDGSAPIPTVQSKVGSGAFTGITGIEVGSRYDSQRRRANRIVESYAAAAWSH